MAQGSGRRAQQHQEQSDAVPRKRLRDHSVELRAIRGEKGTMNEERGTRNEERGTRNEEPGTRNQERGTRNEHNN
jgi:hypothetical protein